MVACMVMHSFCTIFSVPSILLLAPKAKEKNGRGNAGKKTVQLLQNGLQNPAPVSYTHLDVYKRQGQALPYIERDTRIVLAAGAVAALPDAAEGISLSLIHIDEGCGVHIRLRQLVTAAAKVAGRRALEQRCV